MAILFHVSTQVRTILIAIITVATLLGIMLRPWKTNEAQIAFGNGNLRRNWFTQLLQNAFVSTITDHILKLT
ncbi:hypothetical protein [Dictyobacter formicarum]|uniref:Uncharacterized protein n=1 Tax=Dictyobacter formicarum TaxID=2778368 RepID=A0ABQ3VCT0_9CHLR|nr:hypothetical protein [Dictyobacter formicarum]GHO83610.1 hypothetical protein KSZ_16160 [Dictyobacter formicarum]